MAKYRVVDEIKKVEVAGPFTYLISATNKAKTLNKQNGTRRYVVKLCPEV